MSISQLFPEEGPTLNLNFAGSRTLDPRITFTRTSTGTYMGSDGLIKVAPANSPRFDHRYVNGEIESLGLLVEESRVNSIRNNTMVGAVSGTSGTLPTYWSAITSTNGITREVIGTGTENGISYIDIKYSGTNTLGSNFYTDITFDTGTISASQGQTWTLSCYIKLISGVFSGSAFSSVPKLILYGAPSFNDNSTVNIDTITNQSLISQRFTTTKTYANATTTSASTRIGFTIATGATIDFTIRIGMPQLELGSFVTSVIPTSGGTATRTPDNVSITGDNFSDWYNQSEGTIFSTFKCDNWNSSNQFGKVFTINQAIFGVENNGFWIGNDANASNTVRYRVRSGGVNQFGPANLTRTSTTVKSAMSVKSSDFAITIDGNTPTTSTSGTLPQVMNSLTIGRDIVGIEGAHLNGHISQLTYYPTRLTNAQLQTLTK